MKRLIFIDNEFQDKASDNLDFAYRNLKHIGAVDLKRDEITLVSEFHHKESEFEDSLFDTDNVIITWSMFTDNHYGSYDQVCGFMVHAGLAEIKGKIYINTSSYLRETMERAIEHYNQSVYILRCIENNYIIHYDEHETKFVRLRVDLNSSDFLKGEDINLSELLH